MDPQVRRIETPNGILLATYVPDVKPARQLSSDDVFWDGAIILHLSFQLKWIYARCVKEGRFLRRRFLYDSPVTVEKLGTVESLE